MTDPKILEAERFGMPDNEPETVHCASCDSTIDKDDKDTCALCKKPGCFYCLIEIETGEKLCAECFAEGFFKAIEDDPIVQAARRAARTGTHRDLKKYLKLRKART